MNKRKQARRDAKQLFQYCRVNGRIDEERVRQVVQLVSKSQNRIRHRVLSEFQRLLHLDFVERSAKVESAEPLSIELQKNVLAGLERAYGPGMSTSFVHSPELIGGMRIKVGFDVYDGSVSGRLAALEASF